MTAVRWVQGPSCQRAKTFDSTTLLVFTKDTATHADTGNPPRKRRPIPPTSGENATKGDNHHQAGRPETQCGSKKFCAQGEPRPSAHKQPHKQHNLNIPNTYTRPPRANEPAVSRQKSVRNRTRSSPLGAAPSQVPLLSQPGMLFAFYPGRPTALAA